MEPCAWTTTLQWTALFAAQMLAAVDEWILAGTGSLIAAVGLACSRPLARAGALRATGRWTLRLGLLLLATVVVLAWLATARTGDTVLAAQLRLTIARTVMPLLIGSGITGAAVLLLMQLRRASPRRPAQDA